jgi:hypothetical protein
LDCLDDLASVPIVVVAAIGPKAVTPVSKPFETEQVPEGPIQLLKVDISIENVLKGDAPKGKTAFFYLQRTTATGPSLMGFQGTTTFRAILLLRKEQGKLRLLRDVRSNCAPAVFSGAHPGFRPTSGETVGDQMIDLLLTPGKGATEGGMLHAVFERAPFQISPKDTLVKLLGLAVSDRPLIRTAACLEFRDLMADLSVADPKEALDAPARLGVSQSDVERWRRQKDQNGWSGVWWARGPANGWLPSTSLPVNGPRGLALCTDDKLLGVPSLTEHRQRRRI